MEPGKGFKYRLALVSIEDNNGQLSLIETKDLKRIDGRIYLEETRSVLIAFQSRSRRYLESLQRQFSCECQLKPLPLAELVFKKHNEDSSPHTSITVDKSLGTINKRSSSLQNSENGDNNSTGIQSPFNMNERICILEERRFVPHQVNNNRSSSGLVDEVKVPLATKHTVLNVETLDRHSDMTVRTEKIALDPINVNATALQNMNKIIKSGDKEIVKIIDEIPSCPNEVINNTTIGKICDDSASGKVKSVGTGNIFLDPSGEAKTVSSSAESTFTDSSNEEPIEFQPDATDEEYNPSSDYDSELSSEESYDELRRKEHSPENKLTSVRKNLFLTDSVPVEDKQIAHDSESSLLEIDNTIIADVDAVETDILGIVKAFHAENRVSMKLFKVVHEGEYTCQIRKVGENFYITPIKAFPIEPIHECVKQEKPKCVFQYSINTLQGLLKFKACIIGPVCFSGDTVELLDEDGRFITTFSSHDKLNNNSEQKTHYCLFCSKKLKYISDHLKRVHSRETDVIEAMSNPNKRRAFAKIVNKGDRKAEDELPVPEKIALRISDRRSAEDTVVCPTCFGRLQKANFAKHERKCSGRLPNYSRVLEQANDIANEKNIQDPKTYDEMRRYCLKELLAVIKQDEIGHLIRTDFALTLYGLHFSIKSTTNRTKAKNTRMQLRLLARILQEIQFIVPTVTDYRDILSGEGYDVVMYAVVRVIGFNVQEKTMQKTSIALTIKSCLTTLAECVLNHYKKMPDFSTTLQSENSRIESFLDIHRSKEFTNSVTSVAYSIRAVSRLLQAKDIPSILDISKFTRFVIQIAETSAVTLETEGFEYKLWLKLGKAIIILLLIFNRRRIGETSAMLLSLYQKRFTVRNEDLQHMSRLERALANKFSIMKLVGKRVRHLTMLLSESHVRFLETFVKFRDQAEIPETNSYLFAVRADALYMNAADDLRKYSVLCGADNPPSLRATLLRRQIATCSQLLQVSENELRQITDHMGHSFDVHLKSYRTAEAVQQITVISKFLMAIGDSDISKFKGKTLQEIAFEVENNDSEESADMVLPYEEVSPNDNTQSDQNEVPSSSNLHLNDDRFTLKSTYELQEEKNEAISAEISQDLRIYSKNNKSKSGNSEHTSSAKALTHCHTPKKSPLKVNKPKSPKKRSFSQKEVESDLENHGNTIKESLQNVNINLPLRGALRSRREVVRDNEEEFKSKLRNEDKGLKIEIFQGKGRGVVACLPYQKGDFVVEYSGELILRKEAKNREDAYCRSQDIGCYMAYFKHNSKQYCIDATAESSKLGRLVNHSRNANLSPRIVVIDSKPRLLFFAKTVINIGEELTYDYGDRSKESLECFPWLRS